MKKLSVAILTLTLAACTTPIEKKSVEALQLRANAPALDCKNINAQECAAALNLGIGHSCIPKYECEADAATIERERAAAIKELKRRRGLGPRDKPGTL